MLLISMKCIHSLQKINATEKAMKHLTIRSLPPSLSAALEEEKRRRGKSLNRTVIELLSQALGVGTTRSNGLGQLAGTWNEEGFRRFEEAVAPFESTDSEIWR
jgi:hypothetical protein